MCTVAAAGSVRVWAIMSRGRGPRGGPPPLEGVHVDYPPATEMLVRQPFHLMLRPFVRVADGSESLGNGKAPRSSTVVNSR